MKVVPALFGYLACIVAGALVAGEWTEWSTWSGCSQTCGGGGIASQSRRCLGDDAAGKRCNDDGEQGIRYRICGGIQSCRSADSNDDGVGGGGDVCSALEDVLIDGKTFKWTTSAEGGGGSGDCSASCSPINATDAASASAVESAVRVTRPDGTRCLRRRRRLGGSDGDAPGSTSATRTTPPTSGQGGVCVAGVCRSVGCDGVIGPADALDACEICSTDGPTTCSSKVNEKPPTPPVVYEWRESGYSACSASCGIGEQSVVVVCRNAANDVLVSDEFCQLSSTAGDKPHRMRVCVGSDCENDRTMWITDDWQDCSRSCDGGRSLRSVYCVLRSDVDGTYERTDDDLCRRERKPDAERKCNDFDCPKWIAGQWSHCSVSCGGVSGVQQRAVVCKRTNALDCVEAEKPDTHRSCRVLALCPYRHSEIWSPESDPRAVYGLRDFEGVFDINGRLISGDFERGNEVAEHAAPEHQPTEATSPPATDPTPSTRKSETKHEEDAKQTTASTTTPFSSLDESPGTVEKEEKEEKLEPDHHTTQDAPLHTSNNNGEAILEPDPRNWNQSLQPTYDDEFDGRRKDEEDSSEELSDDDEYSSRVGGIDGGDGGESDEPNGVSDRREPPDENKKAISVPSFVVSQWSACSATCGVARRRRTVVCKVLLEHPKIVQDLPDFKCQGPKPKMQDYCEGLPDCASKPAEPKTYSWMLTSYGPCSKTCGGGSQDGEINCIRVPEYYKVEKIRCLRQPAPGRVKRPCNMLPCPPRWNALPYGPCSVSCGGGQQTRQLQCVQDTHDQKLKIVPDAECKDAVSPATSAHCNLVPCPAKWTIGNWTKCSVTCGQGIQMRAIRCEQKLSPHQSVVVDDVSCWQQTDKPDAERVCEAGKCHALNSLRSKSTAIRSEENSNFVQLRPLKTVSLTVGTNASLIAGCLVTIHCPVSAAKNSSSAPKVVWRENGRPIDERKRRRLRVDRHGSLHVRNSRVTDRGVYACFAGGDAANTTITFRGGFDDPLRELRTRSDFLKNADKKTTASYSEDFVGNFQSELKRLFAKTRRRATYSGRFLMSKMAANVVPLQYVPFGWSQCSVECGGGGIQSRDVVCAILADEFFLEVDEGFCSDRRLQKPIVDTDCGFGKCPRWEPGSWGQCLDDNCVAVGTGERRRDFHCVSAGGEELDAHRCRDQPKPNDREDCPNDHCVAVWKPSNWTQCSITCGGRGLRSRNFQCIWRQSKKPVAESLCSLHSKPTSSKSCFVTTPCPTTDCRDESRHCLRIPELKMCPQFREKCCQSCSLVRVNTSQQTTASNTFIHK